MLSPVVAAEGQVEPHLLAFLCALLVIQPEQLCVSIPLYMLLS